ncbi:MAG TPA: ABC transporter ATP-binding protein [Pyrinomonadaceae bacterium]|nr:ABC transporter ATP-binding protein [Pyrinomonadaceae bacterium]
MTIAVRVDSVSKQYRIYDRPADRLKETLTRGHWKAHREFWALKDISFEVEAGTTTGIVGPNGSGKSTLLQIITGTLEPTHGSVSIEGRVAALLELGAGFNPEFTGIENIFMNAALMGLSKSETEQLLPEIASFAEIGDFIYQPLKTYSSGMYIRLAFAAAVAVAPEILIIDEALAVGDAVFQHRCMRRIKEMQEKGTTILFVSHDPGAVRALCNRAILLNQGEKIAEGTPSDVLNRYQKIIMARQQAYEANVAVADRPATGDEFSERQTTPLTYVYRHGDRSAEVLHVELLNSALRATELVETGELLVVRIVYVAHADLDDTVCGFLIRNRHGIHIYGTNTELQEVPFERVKRGELTEVTFEFNCWLAPEMFSLCVAVHSSGGVSFDWLDGCLFFRVMSATKMEGVANLNATATAKRLAGYSESSPAQAQSREKILIK